MELKSHKYERNDIFRPSVGTNFVVQTEDEKLAAKLARKERRRHGGRDEEDESAVSSAMLGFDQDDLRKAREEQLRSNAAMPLASSQQVGAFSFLFVLSWFVHVQKVAISVFSVYNICLMLFSLLPFWTENQLWRT